jgi:hypothetical protein
MGYKASPVLLKLVWVAKFTTKGITLGSRASPSFIGGSLISVWGLSRATLQVVPPSLELLVPTLQGCWLVAVKMKALFVAM